MARTAQAQSATKDKLIGAAQDLMLEQGFTATTVDDICAEAGVTKGSFFHYFESKDDLARQVLGRFCAAGSKMHVGLCGTEQDPLKRVYAYIDNMIKVSRDPVMGKGCLVGMFAQELCDTNKEIREACREAFEDWAGHFGQELSRAKAQYAPKAAFKPKAVAEHLVAIVEGSLIIGKTRRDMSVLAQNLAHFRAYVKILFKCS